MGALLQHLDFANLYSVIVWLIIVYGTVLGAMIVDLISGVSKAWRAGIATTSTGLKKSCTKADKYFSPLLRLSCVDILASAFIAFPIFSILYGGFCIICEFKSIFEKTHTKKEIAEAANTMNVIIKNKDELANLMLAMMQEMSNKNKNDGE